MSGWCVCGSELGDQWEEVNKLCCSLKWGSPRGHVVDRELPDKPIIEIITVLTSTTKKKENHIFKTFKATEQNHNNLNFSQLENHENDSRNVANSKLAGCRQVVLLTKVWA